MIDRKFQDLFNKGNALAISKQYKEAIKAYDEAIDFNPYKAKLWNEKGNLLFY